jgi:hypothetical protein
MIPAFQEDENLPPVAMGDGSWVPVPRRDGAIQDPIRQPALSLAHDLRRDFPEGVIVSLVSAGLLRNSRFMPARQG